MSVVVAIKKDGVVYMGADSQVTKGGTRATLSNPNNYKVWAMNDAEHCLMGSVGTLRVANVVKVMNDLIPEIVDFKHAVDFRFVVRKLVPHIMDELDEQRLLILDKENTPNMGASFLLAYYDRLFSIASDGAVIEIDDFCAIGSGASEALGSLLSSADEKDPVERIKTAIKASAAHDIYVDYPIVVSNTDNTEFEVFYEKNV